MSGPAFQGLPRIPAMQTLFARRKWVAWKRSRDGRKPPINPDTGNLAKIDDPSTWSSYQAAQARARSDGLPGVGYVLDGTDDLTFVDLDADKATGILDPDLKQIAKLAESYSERSPSGKGIRILAQGKIPNINRPDIGIEVYSSGQYLTITGAHIDGTPLDIRPAPKTLAVLVERAGVGEKDTSQGGSGGPRPDDNFWGKVNRAALDDIGRWWRDLFPKGYRTGKSWRAGLVGRGLEEDIAATRDGIVDWGVHDIGDAKEGRRSPIELVVEYGGAADHTAAALWLCDRLGIAPESLGWIGWSQPAGERRVDPTYPSREVPAEEVRSGVWKAIAGFFDEAEDHHADGAPAPAPVHGIKSSTGTSKTQTFAAVFAGHRGPALSSGTTLYLLPTHQVGEEVAEKFEEHGVSAKVWRGRKASDPAHPPKTVKMCLDLDAVRLAESLGEPIESSACAGRDPQGNEVRCKFYGECGYQRQKRAKPRVWIAAHEMLAHPQEAYGEVAAVVIDEGFWQSAIRQPTDGITVDELRHAPLRHGREAADADLEAYRARLARAVDRHGGQRGGLRREHLEAEGITPELCTAAIKAEYGLKAATKIWPGMDTAARKAVTGDVKGNRYVFARVGKWRAVRALLDAKGEVSGRAFLDTKDDTANGRLVLVRVRGFSPVSAGWAKLPTLLLDATLPDQAILERYYANVEIVANFEAAAPHQNVRQVVGSPTSSKKFAKGDPSGRNARDIKRYITKRWLEHGRQETLVICQMEAEAKLNALGLPGSVHVAHYNNIAGLDRYKNVRLLILAGRTLPEPEALERSAGAITGVEPVTKAGLKANGRPWYDRIERGIRLRDGSGRGVPSDKHPDLLVESIRWQVCEAGMVQALGRARGVNRTARNPVQIDILADVVLPMTVDTVMPWDEASADLGGWLEMAAEGVLLESPADMAKAFPAVWATAKAAEHDKARQADFPPHFLNNIYYKGLWGGNTPLKAHPLNPPWFVFTYRPTGRGQQTRRVAFDLGVIQSPRAWLEARLGPLAGFDLAEARAAR